MSSSPTAELVEPEFGAKEPEGSGPTDESVGAEGVGDASDSLESPTRRTEAVEIGGGLLALVETLS